MAETDLTNEAVLTGTADEVIVTGATISLDDAVEEYARRFGIMVIIGAVTGG